MISLNLLANGGSDPYQFDSDYFQFLAILVTSVTTVLGSIVTVAAGVISQRQGKKINEAKSIVSERNEAIRARDIYRNALIMIRGQLSTISYYQEDESPGDCHSERN
ncbi:MAG: hypothetical protein HC825_01670 [Oscillatoriales cyanobacterium RM1_1_9]|nr:hypothetical protein [Oscillatoriales cyanobacterium RM1_1_9]